MTSLKQRAAELYRIAYELSRAGQKGAALLVYRAALAAYAEAGHQVGVTFSRLAIRCCHAHWLQAGEAMQALPAEGDVQPELMGWWLAAQAHLAEARGDYGTCLRLAHDALPLLSLPTGGHDFETWLSLTMLVAECMLARGQAANAAGLLPILRKYIVAGHPLAGRLRTLSLLMVPAGGDGEGR